MDFLGQIIARKRIENRRRAALLARFPLSVPAKVVDRRSDAEAALRRGAGEPIRVIGEIKLRSPSAGMICPRSVGIVQRTARAYAAGGTSAISVLCDRPGFGGSPLDLRRAAAAVDVPLLFKEFVLEEMQLDLACAVGASMALLIVRALEPEDLQRLVHACLERGLAPVVEAADADELQCALATSATIVGVNARDLRTFTVAPERAAELVAAIPSDRIAVHMSGVRDAAAFARVDGSRADALLIGEGLMRAPDPGQRLRDLRSGA